MANVETMGLGPQKSLFVLVIIVGCFAVLWPRILSPMFVGPVKDTISPNNYDRETGCCNVISDNDLNAVKIMAEVCRNILKSHGDKIDSKMEQALSSGTLTKDIIATCRQEVNKTCGVDIALFLDHNIRLGKTFRQILDDVRSYNSSNCLKMNYGVAPWALGVPHLVGKFWQENFDSNSVRQERSPHLQHPPLHPALRERGRAIVPPASVPRPPRDSTVGPLPGRVWPSQLHVYLSNYSAQPMPMRPPMGGAGGVVPPPKSSVGFLMPLYTLCIVVFFFYTIFKMVFSKSGNTPVTGPQRSYIDRPESKFRQSVFRNTSKRDRTSPETKLVVNAISGLVAEVRQQMEETQQKDSDALHNQEAPPLPYTNGSVHHNQREASPIISEEFSRFKETTPPSWEDSTPVDREEKVLAKEFTAKEPSPPRDVPISLRETTPPKEAIPLKEQTPPPKEQTPPPKEQTPPPKEQTPPPKEQTPPPKEQTPPPKEQTPPPKEPTPPPKEPTPPLREEILPEGIAKEEEYERDVALKEATLMSGARPKRDVSPPRETSSPKDLLAGETEEKYGEKIGNVVEEIPIEEVVPERPALEEEAIRQLRSSVEKEKATFKVLGMEMRAHCEGGRPWSTRARTPPTGRLTPPPPRQPTPPVEVSSIYLEGSLPHQSRLLVADSETHTEKLTNGDDKDTPIVLSGKMTLSLINDESAKTTPERDNATKEDLPYDEDEEFVTASAATAPKEDIGEEYDYGSEEEEEEIDEDMEVKHVLEQDGKQPKSGGEKNFENDLTTSPDDHEATNIEEIVTSNVQHLLAAKPENFEVSDIEVNAATNIEDFEAEADEEDVEVDDSSDVEENIANNVEVQAITNAKDNEATNLEEDVSANVVNDEAINLEEAISDNVVNNDATNVHEDVSTNVAVEEEAKLVEDVSVNVVNDQEINIEEDVSTNVVDVEETKLAENVSADVVNDREINIDEDASADEEEVSASEEEEVLASEEDVSIEVDALVDEEVSENIVNEKETNLKEYVPSNVVNAKETNFEEDVSANIVNNEAADFKEIISTNIENLAAKIERDLTVSIVNEDAIDVEDHKATNVQCLKVTNVEDHEAVNVEEDAATRVEATDVINHKATIINKVPLNVGNDEVSEEEVEEEEEEEEVDEEVDEEEVEEVDEEEVEEEEEEEEEEDDVEVNKKTELKKKA